MERERTLFSNNRKVSIRQMKRLLFLELFGISSLILPGLMARFCQTDGIFAIALGAAAAGGLIKWPLDQAAGRIPGAEGADEPSNGKARALTAAGSGSKAERCSFGAVLSGRGFFAFPAYRGH